MIKTKVVRKLISMFHTNMFSLICHADNLGTFQSRVQTACLLFRLTIMFLFHANYLLTFQSIIVK
jgi:hypothetical protein